MRLSLSLLVAFLCASVTGAFVIPSRPRNERSIGTRRNLSPDGVEHAMDSVGLALSLLRETTSKDLAQTDFYFFFFAGSGAAGIGILQIPKILKELKSIREMGEEGPTEGGEVLEVSPIVGIIFPSISKKDVEKVIKMSQRPEKISALSDSMFGKQGYVIQDDYVRSLKGCNPLAGFAIFEGIAGGSGVMVGPPEFEEKIKKYREEGPNAVAKDLQGAVVSKLSAYGVLLFLLYVTIDLIVESGMNAFL